MKKQKEKIEFQTEKFLYVYASSPEEARKFFGAPKNHPVFFHNIDKVKGPCWRLPSNFFIK